MEIMYHLILFNLSVNEEVVRISSWTQSSLHHGTPSAGQVRYVLSFYFCDIHKCILTL